MDLILDLPTRPSLEIMRRKLPQRVAVMARNAAGDTSEESDVVLSGRFCRSNFKAKLSLCRTCASADGLIDSHLIALMKGQGF